MNIEGAFRRELENLENEYAKGFIDDITYNRRLASLEREAREWDEEEWI